MAFHCTSCNGSMVFDPSTQLMRCEHCGNTCEATDFDVVQDRAYGMATFTCQNCGAELEGTDDSLVGFCPYCGGQSLIARPGGSCDVESIIPFQVTKERCIEAYGAYARGVPYLNREFRDPEHIKKFTGIYMPYYQFDASFGTPFVEGERTRNGPNYTEVTTYGIDVELDGDYEHGTPFDASKYLDDEISARCMPFDNTDRRPFRPAYLAGFYADASTVPAELYYQDAAAQAQEDLLSEVGDRVKADQDLPLKSSSRVDTTVTGHHSVLYPLWFLTWRNEDRVAYAVINGQSGQVVSDLPLDLRAFAIGSALISALIFVLLELFLQPTPGLTAFVSLVAATLMAWAIHSSTRRIWQTQTHASDKGWTQDESVTTRPVGTERGAPSSTSVAGLVVALAFVVLPFMRNATGLFDRLGGLSMDLDMLFDARSSLLMRGAPLIVIAIAGFVLIRVLIWHRQLKQWDAPVAIGTLLAAVLINTVIIFVAPVDDLWYYLGDIVCIVGLIVSSLALLRVYNLSTTRPLPKLFDREEVQ